MLTEKPAWRSLRAHFDEIESLHIRDLFATDEQRFESFSLEACGLFFDFSKNRITRETLRLLLLLAEESELERKREALFSGQPINNTENRPALHTVLRQRSEQSVRVDGRDVLIDVREELDRMREFSSAVFCGAVTGSTGRAFTDVVNIGIGGSFLSAVVVCDVLKPYAKTGLSVHFISDVDGKEAIDVLDMLNPETTLFIVSSKTFDTQETMTNARTVRQWLNTALGNDDAWLRHFVAVTAHEERALAFGIEQDRIFRIWDWVGGRYSLWSAIGLPVVLYAGMEQFEQLLEGAYAMDCHFRQAPPESNMPVIMALLGIWYIDFFDSDAQAILPYDRHLQRLPGYLQQLEMESNGKSVTRQGQAVDYETVPVVWGQSGTNGQHAFYQLIHQGTRLIPADFIAPMRSSYDVGDHHAILLTHFFAQTEALMTGRTATEVRQDMESAGFDKADIDRLLQHRVFAGNRPTNTIVFPELNARTLGSLLACYEHKVFVQGVIWDINSFDQWGVELGKMLARGILPELMGKDISDSHDSSTRGLIRYYRRHACRPKQSSS